jgi:membrane-associated phospholipid phosphatase
MLAVFNVCRLDPFFLQPSAFSLQPFRMYSFRRFLGPGVLLLVLAACAITASFLLDGPVERLVLEWNGGHWSRLPGVALLSRYGDWPELMLLGGAGFLIARKLRNVRWQRILLSAMIASTLAGMAVNASRLTTGRTRPRASAEQGWYGPLHDGKWLIGMADFNSFPSGHTATAVGFAGVILFAAPAWGVAAMVAAGSIALARILLGAHHPSDVITASVLSLAIAWLVWEILGRRGRVDFGDRG